MWGGIGLAALLVGGPMTLYGIIITPWWTWPILLLVWLLIWMARHNKRAATRQKNDALLTEFRELGRPGRFDVDPGRQLRLAAENQHVDLNRYDSPEDEGYEG